jgi:hypothetical protein
LVLVVNDQKKDVSSTAGMQTSVATSPLIKERAQTVVPNRLAEIEKVTVLLLLSLYVFYCRFLLPLIPSLHFDSF